jgi:hypothetical protein
MTDPIPAAGSEDGAAGMEFSRIEEYAFLKYKQQQDGDPNGIALAHLKKGRRKWKIDKKYCVHRLRG